MAHDTSHPTPDLGFISPVVAKIAAENGINLEKVPGTGLNGRITKKDVFPVRREWKKETDQDQSSPWSVVRRLSSRQPRGDQLIKHSTIRKQIAEHMVMSKHTSPHVPTVMEVDMSGGGASHGQQSRFRKDGVNLTFTAYFMQAIVAGLKAYPIVNSSWTDEGLLLHREINIGMATSLGEEGLIVPVIKDADGLSLLGMARAVNDLADRARSKKLQPE